MTPTSIALTALLLAGIAAAQTGEWRDEPGGRSASVTPLGAGKEGFTSMGIAFTNTLAASRSLTNQIYLNGSGVAAGDVDGDGWCDIYFAALDRPGALFRNLGNFKFEEATAVSGLPLAPMDSTGVALADLDGDGDLDLVFATVGRGAHIYANDGKGVFSNATPAGGLNGRMGGMSLALADIEGDGDLDIYIANYRTVTIRDEPNTRFTIRMVEGKPTVAAINGRPATAPEYKDRFTYHFAASGGRGTFAHEENGEPDVLLRNDGGMRFTAMAIGDGADLDWGLAAMFRDIDQDGAPDLYVCNDFRSEDRIWLNDGAGKFRAAPKLMMRKQSLSAMSVDFADLNRDGLDDFFVGDMLSRDHKRRITQMQDARPETATVGEWDNRPAVPQNTLFLNGGDGTYREIAQYAGLEASEWTWGVAFMDVDLDGFEDLLVCNGFERDNMNLDVLREMEAAKAQRQLSAAEQLEMRKKFARLNTPNLAFRNMGNLRFEDASKRWGFDAAAVSIGMALADLDNDGDQDVIVNNLNDGALMYRNDSPAARVAVRLKGKGVGARVELVGKKMTQSQEFVSGGRYLSSDQMLRTFAALDGEMTLKVRWRSGKESVIEGVKGNRVYEVDEAGAREAGAKVAGKKLSPIRFEDVSERLNHTHVDEAFDDFMRQPLLPRKYSQQGPQVAWFDADRDGWEDLVIGAGKGGRMAVFRNDAKGGFAAIGFDAVLTRDQAGIVGLPGGVILAGSTHYEDGLAIMSGIRQFRVGAAIDDSIPTLESCTGALALADIDRDGDVDVFRAGRCLPGKIPAQANSRIYKDNRGKLEVDAAASKPFEKLGLISGAVFADFNKDGWPDLAAACEWGPVRIFMNERGAFVEKTKEFGLDEMRGWWNSVAVGDFDGDGRADLVAGNWGANTRYEKWRKHPLLLAHGDFDGDGTYDVVEAYRDVASGKDVPMRNLDALSKAMPMLKEKFPTHAAFASATLADVVPVTDVLSANWLETTAFLNRGDRFEAKALPMEAQLSPVFGISVAEFDGDGKVDLFLAQNFFARHPESPRCDGGWGLVLRGNGAGEFTALSPEESGVRVPGEQRGTAACDFDHDGRIDLVVTQNGGVTKLYRNVSEKK